MIEAVDHINIVVSDLERSIRFYTELLDFQEKQRASLSGDWIEAIVGLKNVQAEVVYIVAPEGEPRLELIHYTSPLGESLNQNSLPHTQGLRHIAFRVKDIFTIAARLKDKGVKVLGEPVTVPSAVVHHQLGQKILCYFLDPDGVLLELSEYRAEGVN